MLSLTNLIGDFTITRIVTLILALSSLTFGTSQDMTGGSVAVEFRGEWVPAKAACTSPLRLKIDAHLVSFVKGTDRAEYRKLEQCFSCMGHDVENITLLSTDAMGDSPFTVYLDGSKKRVGVKVDFSNDKKLGARFPFGSEGLKKCK
jgi:hypothetical protein